MAVALCSIDLLVDSTRVKKQENSFTMEFFVHDNSIYPIYPTMN